MSSYLNRRTLERTFKIVIHKPCFPPGIWAWWWHHYAAFHICLCGSGNPAEPSQCGPWQLHPSGSNSAPPDQSDRHQTQVCMQKKKDQAVSVSRFSLDRNSYDINSTPKHDVRVCYLVFSYSLMVIRVSSIVLLIRVSMPDTKKLMALSSASPFLHNSFCVSALYPNSSCGGTN